MNRKLKLALVTPLLAIGLTGCYYSTATDQAGVHVKGYVLFPTDKSIAGCEDPGTSGRAGIGDTVYKYPAGQRTFKFAGDTIAEAKQLGADAPAITVVKDNIPLSITGTVTFYLNTGDCKTLESFHQNIGVKLWGPEHKPAWVSKNKDDSQDYTGWDAMLDVYIGQPLQQALTDALLSDKKLTYLDLYNGVGRNTFSQVVQANLPVAVKQLAGGDYFDKFTVVIQKPGIPTTLVDQLNLKQAATLQKQTQLKTNSAINTELKSIKNLVKVLGPQGYLEYKQNQLLQQAIANGNVTLLPVPEGSNINVPTPPSASATK
jgi:hypothetical protein